MAKFNVGTFEFPSKKDAQEQYSFILYRNRVGLPITGKDDEMLRALLDQHPWRKSILAKQEIQYFKIEIDKTYHNKQIRAVRTDGTSAAMPLTKAFSKKATITKAQGFRQRCREAVAPQILAYKRQVFGENGLMLATCPITGDTLNYRWCHIDHVKPFEDLVREWEAKTNYDYSKKSVIAFAKWHSEVAVLQALSPKANLSKGRKTT